MALRIEVAGQRDRHLARGAGADLRALHPGRRIDHAALRRHRPRPRDRPPARGDPGRRPLSRSTAPRTSARASRCARASRRRPDDAPALAGQVVLVGETAAAAAFRRRLDGWGADVAIAGSIDVVRVILGQAGPPPRAGAARRAAGRSRAAAARGMGGALPGRAAERRDDRRDRRRRARRLPGGAARDGRRRAALRQPARGARRARRQRRRRAAPAGAARVSRAAASWSPRTTASISA